MKLLIKNMVCDRCKKVVTEELYKIGVPLATVTLGDVDTENELNETELALVKSTLIENGFELLEDKKLTIVELIKTLLIEEIQYLKAQKPESVNYSDYLARKTGYEYAYLSNLFSTETGQTIEQYIIALKIEKAKEWLSYNELTLSEIAWRLSYSSPAHLSNQFKKITGVTPGQFKKEHHSTRKTIDKIS